MSDVSDSGWSEIPASNLSPDGVSIAEGMPPANVNNAMRAICASVKKFWGRIQGRYASTGSANAYVVTPDVALAAYITGERYSFRSSFANTATATVNISALGAKTIKKYTSGGKIPLDAGDIQSGQPVTVEYDGTDLVMVTPPSNYEEGTWTPTLKGSTSAGTHTYITRTGSYVRIGKLVTAWCRVDLSARGAATGDAQIDGLPFTVSNASVPAYPAAVAVMSGIALTAGYTQFLAHALGNTTTIALTQAGSNISGVVIPITAVGNSAGVELTLSYLMA